LRCEHIPWYLPENLGGFGLPVPDKQKEDLGECQISFLDYCLGEKIINNEVDFKFSKLPARTDWNVNSLVMSKLNRKVKLVPGLKWGYSSDETAISQYGQYYGYQCLQTLFTCTLDQIKKVSLKPKEKRMQRRLEVRDYLKKTSRKFQKLSMRADLTRGKSLTLYRQFRPSDWSSHKEILPVKVSTVNYDSIVTDDLVNHVRNSTDVLCFNIVQPIETETLDVIALNRLAPYQINRPIARLPYPQCDYL
jgi:hypothetical protein